MTDVSTWDTTAANNNLVSPNGFPENMAPSGVNDSAREVMAAVARWYAEVAPFPGELGFIAAHDTLVVNPDGTNPLYQVDVAVNEIVVSNTSSHQYLLSSVNVTGDITASGANGLDTGAEASSTWYYIWVIYNPTTTTSAALLSVQSSLASVTLPAGYTHGALVGAVYNSSGSAFVDFKQRNRCVYYPAQTSVVSAATPGTTYASASFAAHVPPNAQSIDIVAAVIEKTGANLGTYVTLSYNGTNDFVRVGGAVHAVDAEIDNWLPGFPNEGQTVYYKATKANDEIYLSVTGYSY